MAYAAGPGGMRAKSLVQKARANFPWTGSLCLGGLDRDVDEDAGAGEPLSRFVANREKISSFAQLKKGKISERLGRSGGPAAAQESLNKLVQTRSVDDCVSQRRLKGRMTTIRSGTGL